ncbi:uncharacterized protein LOC128856484 [Anastrepha ludens]|uniref:uncharacterized protein LOC128856484 n=1 Tax=Anastrepha ludens TaxID=28586 RepID=UPI0023AFEED8|nr:uncharacterized protein LOC128856484 [Anastrepha ludens]
MKYLYKILIIISTVRSLSKFVSGYNAEAQDIEDYENTGEYADASEDEEDYKYLQILPDECISIGFMKLQRICTAVTPEDLKDTHNDNLVKTNGPYSVFQFPYDDTNRYFLTFHRSPLLYCKQLEVIDFRNFKCTDALGHERDVKLKSGLIKCLGHPSEMVDELLLTCSSRDLESSVFSALHYADLVAENRSSGCNALSLSWLLQLGSVLVVIVCVFQHCATFGTKFKVS